MSEMASNIKKNKIMLFEAFVDGNDEDSDLGGSNSPKTNRLKRIMKDMNPFLRANNIRLQINGSDYVLTNSKGDLLTLSENDDKNGFTALSSLVENGDMDEYQLGSIEDIIIDIKHKLIEVKNVLGSNDLSDYGMDKSSLPSENEEVFENEKTTLTTPEASIKLNKGYNFEPTPGHKDTNPWYSNVISKRIEIGSTDPVKSFQEWGKNYWRKNGEQHLKYEPNSGVPQEEKVKSI
jgi:hypothetical protein